MSKSETAPDQLFLAFYGTRCDTAQEMEHWHRAVLYDMCVFARKTDPSVSAERLWERYGREPLLLLEAFANKIGFPRSSIRQPGTDSKDAVSLQTLLDTPTFMETQAKQTAPDVLEPTSEASTQQQDPEPRKEDGRKQPLINDLCVACSAFDITQATAIMSRMDVADLSAAATGKLQGLYPMHIAAFNKDKSGVGIQILHQLLQRRADPNVLDRKGKTPLFKAASVGNIAALRLLLDSGRCQVTPDMRKQMLTAASHNNSKAWKYLQDNLPDTSSDNGGTPVSNQDSVQWPVRAASRQNAEAKSKPRPSGKRARSQRAEQDYQ